MKFRTATTGIAFLLLILTLTFAAACNGDDDAAPATPTPVALSPERYFDRLDGIFQEADERTAEIEGDFNEALDNAVTLDDQLGALNDFLSSLMPVVENAITRMDDLDPPEEAQDDHQSFIAAGQEIIRVANELLDDLVEVDTEEEAQALIERFDEQSSEATTQADEACLNLQELAEENDIDVDLRCGA